MHRAATLHEMNIPGFDFHALRGRPVRYSVHVDGPWCITFERIDGDAWRVDLGQYHWERPMAKRMEYIVARRSAMPPVHPGEILRIDVLPALNLSVSEAARQLRISRQTLHRIMAGRMAVSPDMAVRLGKFCGNGADLWLRLQAAYDLWHAERRLKREVAAIPTRTAKRPA